MHMFSLYKDTINKRTIYLFCTYFLFFFFHGPLEQSIALFFDSKGVSTSTYGIFLALNNGIDIILPALVAYFTVKMNYKFVTTAGLMLAVISGSLLGWSSSDWGIICLALLMFTGRSFFNFSFGSVVTANLPAKSRANYFVIRDLFLYGGISLGLFAASMVIQKANISYMYIIFSTGLICVVWFILFDQTASISTTNEDLTKTVFKLSFLKNKTVCSLILVQCLKMIYGSCIVFVPLLGTRIGINYNKILTIFAVVGIINMVASFILSYISNEKGKKNFYIADIAIDIIPCLLFAISDHFIIYILGIAVSSIKDAFSPISFAYLYECLDEDTTITMIGMIESASNILGIIVPVLIGFLWEYSYRSVFLLGAMACGLAVFISIKNLPDIRIQ